MTIYVGTYIVNLSRDRKTAIDERKLEIKCELYNHKCNGARTYGYLSIGMMAPTID